MQKLKAKNKHLKYCRNVYEAGYFPICPRLMHTDFLDDKVPQEHSDRLTMAMELLRRCHIVVVCGSATDKQVKK